VEQVFACIKALDLGQRTPPAPADIGHEHIRKLTLKQEAMTKISDYLFKLGKKEFTEAFSFRLAHLEAFLQEKRV